MCTEGSPGTDGATSAPTWPCLRSTSLTLPLPALPLPASESCQRSEDQSLLTQAGAACLQTCIVTKRKAALRSAPLNPAALTTALSPSWSTSPATSQPRPPGTRWLCGRSRSPPPAPILLPSSVPPDTSAAHPARALLCAEVCQQEICLSTA